ncbi:hypothetical protein FBULB1_12839 [Fusarium bulbicola]|nr:hypothetical protein FBULB1_12839 [Fusarium bulbicola]
MVGFEELVEAMKGEDTLSGWDVLVSYNESQLNALLAERARTLNFTMPDTWETPYTDFVGNTYNLVFDVTLSQPTMKFTDTTNSITLTMGLAGQYVAKETGMTTALPSGLTCEVSTSLVNVAGEWHEEGWTPAPPIEGEEEAKKDNWVVIIEPGDSNARGICVDLKYCVVELGEASGANIPEGTMALLDPQIKPFIRKHFAKYGYRLCLAAIRNHFDVSETDSLKGGPNTGTTPSPETSISFAPSSIARSPIPKGNNASIIFSHTTMASLFLGPALKQSPDITDVKCTSTRTYHGMRFTIDFTSHALAIPPLDWQGIPGDDYHVDGCNINLNENSCTLTIYADTRPGTIGHDPFSLSWSSSTKKITSKSHQSGSMQGKRPPSQYSSCSATFSHKANRTLAKPKPEDDRGEQFLIHLLTGAIRMRNYDIVPQQIYNTEIRRVMVTWQSPATGATYSASFGLCVDQDTLALGTKCEGTIARSGDESGPQPFAAFRKGFPPPPTLLKGSDAGVLHPLGEEKDPADKASLYLSMAVAGISIVSTVVSIGVLCWKTARTNREMAFKDKIIKEQNVSIEKMVDSIKIAASNSLRQECGNHVTAQGLALEDLEKRVDAAAKAKLAEILKTDKNALNGPNQQDVLSKLRQAAKETLVQEAPSALNSLTRAVIQGALARNLFNTALPNGRPETILGELQAQEAKRDIDLLEDAPVPGSKAFSELSARKVADDLKSKDEAAKKFEKDVVEEAKKKAEDPGATEAAKQAYKDAQKELDKMKEAREAEDEKHENAKENERKGDDCRIERERQEQESREIETKKREHVF